MEELIITYLLERGGIFGLLLSIAIFWIIFRERMIFMTSSKKKDSPEVNEIEKILYKNLRDDISNINSKALDIESKIAEVEKKVEDLWDWHNVKDSEGVPLWYVRKSIEVSIEHLEVSVDGLKSQIADSIKQLNTIVDDKNNTSEKLQKVNDDRIEELKSIIANYNKTMNDLSLALEKLKYALRSRNE